MPDVTEVIDDPDLGGGQPFQVVRQVRRRTLQAGASESIHNEHINLTGNIQPAQTDDLQLLPEEDRKTRTIVIRALFAFQLGSDAQTSYTPADIVIFHDEVYKVIRIDDWSNWGFQTAYASFQKGMTAHDFE